MSKELEEKLEKNKHELRQCTSVLIFLFECFSQETDMFISSFVKELKSDGAQLLELHEAVKLEQIRLNEFAKMLQDKLITI